ncbi:putative ribonucleases P/MRP protein subunit POP1 [Monocercomonoides exilis]|uniref:putative ribonucleases P/MRP protein subunit POP1 n=1 Tax=Monocercomonoides exilis TaxID=2049356 RepID=UPI00355A76A9|nr:putative ribonucleases P/MRP protein subunit POP1 [Monocercomonoides exilis]|eukprot:MONOS_9059.1-p1 / transcript=MONOS_9059.1 / gene=MONOS_9059 / organism=Monocercomonoides_exilis_PA203 / gene_product=POP1-domain-containing protein / transcript_product=POP1-domain-containing protein / location=Mono_scaffold00361:1517-7829(-) / protein_length=2032 / sequence_SO=supercontig / SO=protein_coding / is_pseudo=false
MDDEFVLPSKLNIDDFLSARQQEIEQLKQLIRAKRREKNTRSFQTLPRFLRRRTQSHNLHRVPASIRCWAEKEFKASPPNHHPPSRKKRRFTNHLLHPDYRWARESVEDRKLDPTQQSLITPSSSSEEKTYLDIHNTNRGVWLETHIWHAKRFHMENKWGFMLAKSPTCKSYTQIHKALSEGCVLHDASYLTPLRVKASHAELEALLKKSVYCETCDFSDTLFLAGGREVLGLLHWSKGDNDFSGPAPDGIIGRVGIMYGYELPNENNDNQSTSSAADSLDSLPLNGSSSSSSEQEFDINTSTSSSPAPSVLFWIHPTMRAEAIAALVLCAVEIEKERMLKESAEEMQNQQQPMDEKESAAEKLQSKMRKRLRLSFPRLQKPLSQAVPSPLNKLRRKKLRSSSRKSARDSNQIRKASHAETWYAGNFSIADERKRLCRFQLRGAQALLMLQTTLSPFTVRPDDEGNQFSNQSSLCNSSSILSLTDDTFIQSSLHSLHQSLITSLPPQIQTPSFRQSLLRQLEQWRTLLFLPSSSFLTPQRCILPFTVTDPRLRLSVSVFSSSKKRAAFRLPTAVLRALAFLAQTTNEVVLREWVGKWAEQKRYKQQNPKEFSKVKEEPTVGAMAPLPNGLPQPAQKRRFVLPDDDEATEEFCCYATSPSKWIGGMTQHRPSEESSDASSSSSCSMSVDDPALSVKSTSAAPERSAQTAAVASQSSLTSKGSNLIPLVSPLHTSSLLSWMSSPDHFIRTSLLSEMKSMNVIKASQSSSSFSSSDASTVNDEISNGSDLQQQHSKAQTSSASVSSSFSSSTSVKNHVSLPYSTNASISQMFIVADECISDWVHRRTYRFEEKKKQKAKTKEKRRKAKEEIRLRKKEKAKKRKEKLKKNKQNSSVQNDVVSKDATTQPANASEAKTGEMEIEMKDEAENASDLQSTTKEVESGTIQPKEKDVKKQQKRPTSKVVSQNNKPKVNQNNSITSSSSTMALEEAPSKEPQPQHRNPPSRYPVTRWNPPQHPLCLTPSILVVQQPGVYIPKLYAITSQIQTNEDGSVTVLDDAERKKLKNKRKKERKRAKMEREMEELTRKKNEQKGQSKESKNKTGAAKSQKKNMSKTTEDTHSKEDEEKMAEKEKLEKEKKELEASILKGLLPEKPKVNEKKGKNNQKRNKNQQLIVHLEDDTKEIKSNETQTKKRSASKSNERSAAEIQEKNMSKDSSGNVNSSELIRDSSYSQKKDVHSKTVSLSSSNDQNSKHFFSALSSPHFSSSSFSETQPLLPLGGVDVILPSQFSLPFFHSFVKAGALPIGIDDVEWLNVDSSSVGICTKCEDSTLTDTDRTLSLSSPSSSCDPSNTTITTENCSTQNTLQLSQTTNCFSQPTLLFPLSAPTFLPDTASFSRLSALEHYKLLAKHASRPPSARINYEKKGIDFPFTCEWKLLFSEEEANDNQNNSLNAIAMRSEPAKENASSAIIQSNSEEEASTVEHLSHEKKELLTDSELTRRLEEREKMERRYEAMKRQLKKVEKLRAIRRARLGVERQDIRVIYKNLKKEETKKEDEKIKEVVEVKKAFVEETKNMEEEKQHNDKDTERNAVSNDVSQATTEPEAKTLSAGVNAKIDSNSEERSDKALSLQPTSISLEVKDVPLPDNPSPFGGKTDSYILPPPPIVKVTLSPPPQPLTVILPFYKEAFVRPYELDERVLMRMAEYKWNEKKTNVPASLTGSAEQMCLKKAEIHKNKITVIRNMLFLSSVFPVISKFHPIHRTFPNRKGGLYTDPIIKDSSTKRKEDDKSNKESNEYEDEIETDLLNAEVADISFIKPMKRSTFEQLSEKDLTENINKSSSIKQDRSEESDITSVTSFISSANTEMSFCTTSSPQSNDHKLECFERTDQSNVSADIFSTSSTDESVFQRMPSFSLVAVSIRCLCGSLPPYSQIFSPLITDHIAFSLSGYNWRGVDISKKEQRRRRMMLGFVLSGHHSFLHGGISVGIGFVSARRLWKHQEMVNSLRKSSDNPEHFHLALVQPPNSSALFPVNLTITAL